MRLKREKESDTVCVYIIVREKESDFIFISLK